VKRLCVILKRRSEEVADGLVDVVVAYGPPDAMSGSRVLVVRALTVLKSPLIGRSKYLSLIELFCAIRRKAEVLDARGASDDLSILRSSRQDRKSGRTPFRLT